MREMLRGQGQVEFSGAPLFGVCVCEPGLTPPLLAPGLCIFSDPGTLFLWIYWPSFNSASSSHGDAQHRAALNTYLSLAASVLTTVTVSSVIHKKGKLDMVSRGLWEGGGGGCSSYCCALLTPQRGRQLLDRHTQTWMLSTGRAVPAECPCPSRSLKCYEPTSAS